MSSAFVSNNILQGSIDSIRTKIKDLEQNEKLIAVTSEMDLLLNNQEFPLEDLCCALDINQKTELEECLNIAQKLADKISKQLNLKENGSVLKFQESSWIYLRPFIEHLIDHFDSSIEERSLYYKILETNINEHNQWSQNLSKHYRYPVAICEKSTINDIYDIYNAHLVIKNYTKREKEARDNFSYRYYGGKHGQSTTFYNLMVRAGLSKDNFKKGKYNYRNSVYVKSVTLQSNDIPGSVKELLEIVMSTHKNTEEIYIAFIFKLNENIPFTFSDLYNYNCMIDLTFFKEYTLLAKIIEKKCVHLCFKDDKQKKIRSTRNVNRRS